MRIAAPCPAPGWPASPPACPGALRPGCGSSPPGGPTRRCPPTSAMTIPCAAAGSASSAARLQAGPAGSRARGGPAGTPPSLLRACPRLLADAGDLDRLVALATDPARHHRMLDATGGDAAAIAEIAAAVALASTSHSPD